MATGLPFIFEDTTGEMSGPADFFDIYDRPPFLRLVPRSNEYTVQNQNSSVEARKTIHIYELGARTFVNPRRQHGAHPSAVIALEGESKGSVSFRTGAIMQIDRWLKKSSRFGSTLTRRFEGSDGIYYQWSYRTLPEHEWVCVELGSNSVIGYYDVNSDTQPRYKTSGNFLTVYENWVYLSIELLASLVIMRHIKACSTRR